MYKTITIEKAPRGAGYYFTIHHDDNRQTRPRYVEPDDLPKVKALADRSKYDFVDITPPDMEVKPIPPLFRNP